jgi:hypothetical protein
MPSVNGPSVMSTSPSVARTTVATSAGCRPPVNTPGARGPHFLIEGLHVPHDRLEDFGRRRIPVRLVDAEQVLLHLVIPFVVTLPGGGRAGPGLLPSSTRIRHARIDTAAEGGVR